MKPQPMSRKFTSARMTDRYAEWAATLAVAVVGFVVAAKAQRAAGARVAAPAAAFGGDAAPPLLAEQARRAQEEGRGRLAGAPWRIPWRGWKDILHRSFTEFQNDRVTSLAGGVVFFSLLALFPAITAGVSLYGLFTDVHTIGGHLALAANIVPVGALDIIGDQIARIVSKGTGQLTFGFLFGLGLALWSANAGVKAMFDALNIIYGEQEKRGFIKLNVVSLTFTFCTIVVAQLLLAGVVVVPLLFAAFGLPTGSEAVAAYGRWPLMFIVAFVSFLVLYRFGPSRRHAQWRWLMAGAALAALLWIAVSSGFSLYLSRFANYDATYGSLGAVIGMMMWMWLSAIVVLVGAELNAEIEHQTALDTTAGAARPLGARQATMADTVGAARLGSLRRDMIRKRRPVEE